MPESPIVDFSFVYEVAEDDNTYSFELISLYLKTLTAGMIKLEQLVRETDDYEAIHKQAHFLKSSSKIVQVRNLYDNLLAMERLATAQEPKPAGEREKKDIVHLLDVMTATCKEAEPVLKAEIKKLEARLKK